MNDPIAAPLPGEQLVVKGQPIAIRPGRVLDVAVHTDTAPGATVVFLCHGAGGNKNQWRNQWQALIAAGYRIVAWDTLGHGASRRPRRASTYDGQELIRDYAAIFDRYHGVRNIVVGHSMGASMTLSMLQRLQLAGRIGQVGKAVLLGAQLNYQRSRLLGTPVFYLNWIRSRLERQFKEAAWHPEAPAQLVEYEQQVTHSNSLRVFKAMLTRASRPDVDRLSMLRLPILLMSGDSDRLTPAEGARQLAERLPNATLQVIERCGHQIMLEQPERVNALLLDFIKPST
jgi:pimeloyl-ACP methyl ester carboxylesterase